MHGKVLLKNFNNMNPVSKEEIEKKASALWGKDLHQRPLSAPVHCDQFLEVFPSYFKSSLKGNFLEIGCGSGADLEVFLKIDSIKKITAIDLGENINSLKTKFKNFTNIQIEKGNALDLPFSDNIFDTIYSFGIFHHTADPLQCFQESFRVLNKNGSMFLYLYSAHEKIFLKRLGIILEKLIMKIFEFIPYKIQELFCILLSPICWLIFSIPSKLLFKLGAKEFSRKIPFYFGTNPFSLIKDLKDRLMSPINHRFTKIEIEKILKSLNFSYFEVINNSAGLYIYAKK